MVTTQDTKLPMRVMLIHDDPICASSVEKSLTDLDFELCGLVSNPFQVLKEISGQTPDLIIVDIPLPSPAILEVLTIVAAHNPTPVVMFSAQEDPEYIASAVAAGVSTYLIGRIDPSKIRPIIEVAFAQFQALQKLHGMLDQVRSELTERCTIDKAKQKIMRALNIDESLAYKHLRTEAMNCGLSIAAISKKINAANLD